MAVLGPANHATGHFLHVGANDAANIRFLRSEAEALVAKVLAYCATKRVTCTGTAVQAGDDATVKHLTAADRALAAGDVERASVALDAAAGTTGRDQERASMIALEAVHGSRSRDAWEAKLATRGYGLVPVAEGNKTSWVVEDRRTDKRYALTDLGFTGAAEPAKIEAAWSSGMAVDIRKTLVEKDIISSKQPEPWVQSTTISERAIRADNMRHGQERAVDAAVVARLSPEQIRAVIQAKKDIIVDRTRDGISDTKVTAEQLDAKLSAAGVSFGAEIDPEGNPRALGFREALARAEPAPETKAHMQRWLSGTVWSTQSAMLSEGKTPSWPAYQEALADRGVSVERQWDGDTKTFGYRYSTTLAGIGSFSNDEKELGFDASKDPRLSTHAFVESGDQADFRARATNALSAAVKQAGEAGISKLWTSERERVDSALEGSGMRIRIMEQEHIGRQADGQAVFAVRLGIEDQGSGRIMPISECGFGGTEHALLGNKIHMVGGPVKYEKMDPKEAFEMFSEGFKGALSGMAASFDAAITGGRVNFNAGAIDSVSSQTV